ncbi:cytochrome c [Nitrosomonas sp. HPC101]|nr:cytochrome c [Nitrosomonas sp. HPC101]
MLLAPLASSAQSPAPAVDETLLRRGNELYQYWCATCHGRGPGHPGTQALETRYGGALPAVLEDRPNLTPDFVGAFVRNGISIMPFFRKTEINDEELAAIGAYLSHTPIK